MVLELGSSCSMMVAARNVLCILPRSLCAQSQPEEKNKKGISEIHSFRSPRLHPHSKSPGVETTQDSTCNPFARSNAASKEAIKNVHPVQKQTRIQRNDNACTTLISHIIRALPTDFGLQAAKPITSPFAVHDCNAPTQRHAWCQASHVKAAALLPQKLR